MAETNGSGTAVATVPTPPTDKEIEAIRARGSVAIAHQREMKILASQIAGMEWGSGHSIVKGAEFSPATRYAFAEFCRITRANPMLHVDVLGGKPYLNALFWMDRVNTDPAFYDYQQRDISSSVEAALRKRAADHREVAATLDDASEAALRKGKALDLEEAAADLAMARAQWSAPGWAEVVIETTIRRFANVAPIEAIRSGEIREFERYLVSFPECNWAGGKPRRKKRSGGDFDPDPIGNLEPAKTARTRSFRRAARTAFPAWMPGYDEQIRKTEHAVEAEFEVLVEPPPVEVPGAPQAAQLGSGEPAAAEPAAEIDPALDMAVMSYEEACRALGEDPKEFAAKELLRPADTIEDYNELRAKLNAMADADEAEEQRSLIP